MNAITNKDKRNLFLCLLILAIIWLAGAVGDRIWFALDRSVPAWDQAEYLTGSLNYWQILQEPQWFNSEWWTSFWMRSSKVPPLTFIVTAVVQDIFGTGPDQATLVNLFFSAILLGSVYGLGVELFGVEVGLWAAGLCQLLPGLYRVRLDFLLDYPLTAVVTLSFWCLTVWRNTGRTTEAQRTQRRGWFWAIAFGLCFGLALLVKQTALFFLLVPLVWVGVEAIAFREWGRVMQLVGGLLLCSAMVVPWFRNNWLLVLTGGKRATVDSAIAEGDPDLDTIAAWTYYWNCLPAQVSWLLLLVPIVGLLLYWIRRGISWKDAKFRVSTPLPTPLVWLAVFWIGAYLLCSLNINKDLRYVLPYLPVVSLFLAYGLTRWRCIWGNRIRWGTVGLAILLMFLNLFPVARVLGERIAESLSPNAQHYVYLKPAWPHPQVIDEIIQQEPHLRSTLGVLPSTPEVNQHNFNYYGALQDFQVYGRQVGTRSKQIFQDTRALDWFITKTGDQGSVPSSEAMIVQTVERSPDFQLQKSWNLPDGSTLKLYHRLNPPIQVHPLSSPPTKPAPCLLRVTVPEQAPPGVPVPVTYEWSGSWEQLQSGLVLLTWRDRELPTPQYQWLHDHGIGMGALHPHSPLPNARRLMSGNPPMQLASPHYPYLVTEQMAMLPPDDIPAGTYTLEATYLNRRTGETYPISVPPVTLKIVPEAAAVPATELDLLTQLRNLAAILPKGSQALDRIFEEIGRINQYDPIQDYLVQTQLALEYRLQLEPQNLTYAYSLALAQVLQRQVKGALAALERVTQLDSQNPYAYAYLAFVHLYNWNPRAANIALQSVRALNPNLPELQILSSVAALMQGNFLQAWQLMKGLGARG